MIEPDTKDWTWVLDRPCGECGFTASEVEPTAVAGELRVDAEGWSELLAMPGVARRPRPEVWSPLEYAAHVRDVHAVFAHRVALVLDRVDPEFENWDQDRTARERRYDLADPDEVAAALLANADDVAGRYDAVPADAWSRTARRSNGSVFTLDTLARYHLHDVRHHAWDVRAARTRLAYQCDAAEYATLGPSGPDLPAIARGRRRFVADARAAAGRAAARVLEIGSAAGRDARALEAAGLDVRRTDVTPGFVDLMRADGVEAEVLDPLVDDLDDPRRPGVPYDGVWAAACLLHVGRDDLPRVLRRLAAATRPAAPLWMTLKEGRGDGWSTHGVVRTSRSFTYWEHDPLVEVATDAGWRVATIEQEAGQRDERWLCLLAHRAAG